jgi:hypothetical protein
MKIEVSSRIMNSQEKTQWSYSYSQKLFLGGHDMSKKLIAEPTCLLDRARATREPSYITRDITA